MVYSMYDRMVVGGAMPVNEELKLEAIDPLKAQYFTTRREVGIFNVGQGEGVVKVGDEEFTLGYKEALYIGPRRPRRVLLEQGLWQAGQVLFQQRHSPQGVSLQEGDQG